MSRVLCSSPYIPQPWIASHGMMPVLLQPSWNGIHACVARMEGLCPYAQAWISHALADPNAAAIIVATTCDQMRRGFEVLHAHAHIPCFLCNIPSTWQTVQARRQFRDETERLGRFLEKAGGCRPSQAALREHMLRDGYPEYRAAASHHKNKIPLALTGPHGMAHDAVWLDLLDASGGAIALDCSQAPRPCFDRRALAARPFEELTDGCLDAIQDIFQRPNSRFYQRLADALKQEAVKGLIVRRFLWCDLWHAEVARLKQWASVPVLDLEIGPQPAEDRHRLATRIQSFLEMLS